MHPEAEPSTRERIVVAAMSLFGERGYSATTIGHIEAAAGLAPRRGGLYRHFDSKESVFRAAVGQYAEKYLRVEAKAGRIDLDDPHGTLTGTARFVLSGLLAEADLFRIMQRDAHRFPDLAEHVHAQLIERGYRSTTELFQRFLVAHGRSAADAAPLASIALGALVHYREDEAIYGRAPGDVSEDDFVRVWVDTWALVLTGLTRATRAPGGDRGGDPPAAPTGSDDDTGSDVDEGESS